MNPYIAEYLGTLVLVLLGNGVVAGVSLKSSKSESAGYLVVVICWGLAVITGIYIAGPHSGAHLNPAVTLAFFLNGSFPESQVAGYMIAQLLGGISGAALVWLNYYPHWKITTDPAAKLGSFSTSPAIRNTFWNLFSEFLATFVLIIGLLFIGQYKFTDGLNPLAVGGLVAVIGLGLGGTIGWAINPARDAGPRIAYTLLPIPGKGSPDWSYGWIPVVGPFAGSACAVLVFNALF